MGFAKDIAGAALNPIGTVAGALGAPESVQAAMNPIGAAANMVTGGGGQQSFRDAAQQQFGQPQPQGQAPAQPQQQQPQQPQQDPMAGKRFGHQAPGSGGMTQAPEGFDFRSPGVGEQFFNQQQGAFAAPGQGEQFWNQVQGKFNQPRATQEQYEQFQGGPGFDAYYDRAKERTLGSMNDQLAARGVHGSSAGMDMIGQALTDLEAQRANREADYRLQEAQTGGQLAQAADAGRLADIGTFGNLAFGAQDALQGRTMQGMDAAAAAQGLHRQRGRDYMADLFRPASTAAGLQNQAFSGMIGGDQALLDSMLGLDMTRGREALNQDYRRSEKVMSDAGALFDMGKTAGLI